MVESQQIRRVNIKKKKNRSLYFGVAVDTGELLSIEAVPRGLSCKCICPACGTRLEARKGEKKAHHFAHETNNECHYGPELGIQLGTLCRCIVRNLLVAGQIAVFIQNGIIAAKGVTIFGAAFVGCNTIGNAFFVLRHRALRSAKDTVSGIFLPL